MKIKVFKNGNINVKFEDGDSTDNLLHALLNDFSLDFIVAGDEGCAGNYDMYYPLFNPNNELLYLILESECVDYKNGKSIKLVGRELDEDEREELRAEGII